MKFSRKNIENWRNWKMSLFLVGHFDFDLKKFFFASLILMITLIPAQNNTCL